MSEVTYESVLAQAQQLPRLDRQRLRQQLAEEEAPPPPKVSAKQVPWKDRSHEYRWLREHARAYVGKWVALEGDQMVACGESALEVMEAAKAVGIDRPIVVQVEDPDGPPFAGF